MAPQMNHEMSMIRRSKSTAAAAAAHDDPPSSGSSSSRAAAAAAAATKPFPSLVLGAHGSVTASGSFAEAQKVFLEPDADSVAQLAALLRATRTGVVAHYYMDVELQGVLHAVGKQLLLDNNNSSSSSSSRMVGIADSLKMGDMAVDMVTGSTDGTVEGGENGCSQIACLGVDFMAESVAAILQKNGHADIPVYRADQRKIGCSLAESAERDGYRAWLQAESSTGASGSNSSSQQPVLHVIYINTSLETKAVSNSLVPTITCTSSNVLQTLLTASAQIKDLKILYGPDTYMGDNLVTLLTMLTAPNDDTSAAAQETGGGGGGWSDDQIRKNLHPEHDRASLARLRDSIAVFPSGNCVVHHMFGTQVVDTVKSHYPDAFVTAHLEVPGEMFAIAMKKSLTDQGVVGSTSDILNFISRKVREAAAVDHHQQQRHLQFILGTEAGMVTSIVSSVQSILQETGNTGVTAEIVFPVASEAVMATPDEDNSDGKLQLVPGVAGGEGCSTAGGCATCPFMKMNNLDALINVLELIQQQQSGSDASAAAANVLLKHLPPDRLRGKRIDGRPAVDLGTEPIVYMREFNKTKRLPEDLVQRIMQGKKVEQESL